MAEDEGRMLPPKEARVRRRIASIAKKDAPKPFLFLDKYRSRGDARATRRFDKQNPQVSRRFSGYGGTKVRGEPHNVVGIEARYHPETKRLKIQEVFPMKVEGKNIEFGSDFAELHKQVGNKVLSPPTVKGFVEKAANMFPKAKELIGNRVTGVHGRAANKILDAARKTGSLDLMEKAADKADLLKTQNFNLEGVRKRVGRLGKVGKVLGLGLAAYDVVRNLNKE